jgi:2-oxoglutarate ferredoxin oxidoreductase subunit gamma
VRHEVLVSGKGGQGVILAGVVLAEAAGVGEQYEVVQTQVYGPESRGGASRSGVVISDEPILYPEVTKPDVFVALSQEACDRFAPTLKPGARMLVDRGWVDPSRVQGDVEVYALPFTDTAEALGAKILANMVALGALSAITRLVSPDALRRAIQTRTAANYHDSNLRAFEAGLKLVGQDL